ncbi:hypothetical protein ACQ4PT_060552 [Festuca glaucescens]
MADSAAAAEAAQPATVGQAVIPLVNRLQDIMARLDGDAAAGVELPQVAAIGGQSSGKSSVLEALVGRDFLPRGPEICTRRPLVLQLVRHSAPEEWGEFLHAPGRRFHDFEHIKREIQSETDKEAGGNKGVSEKQIRLKIFSPNVIDITLVDLPGITRVPVGDQPSDIESRIRTMIMQYIKHPSCIILAVSPANADLANSDALQLARLGDPDGSRTIGVITKLDIMDRGTDARNFLLGNVIPLKLGYVGIVNRSQEILLKHITDMLPGLKSRINAQLVAVAKEHAAYGDAAESTEVDPCKNISDEDIRTSIQNSGGPKGAMFLPEVPFEILVRRQIGRLLDPSLQCAKFIYDELVKISHGCLTSELQKYPILKRRMGESVSNFLRDGLRPAETMITHIIEMEDGIAISSEMQLKSSIENNVQLKSERGQKSRAVFARDATRGATAEQMLTLDTEYVWVQVTENPSLDRRGTSAAGGGQKGNSLVGGSLSNMPGPRVLNSLYSMIRLREPPITLKPSENKTDQDRTEIAIVKLLVKSYYDIVRKSIEDAVPKAIMHFLVNHTKRELHNVLIRKLYIENLLDEMLRETDEVLIRRQRIQETLQVLEQAHRTLEEFPLEAEKVEKGYSLSEYTTGLPKLAGLGNRSLS